VKLGKMMWNKIVNANCSRARRTGSKSIANLSRARKPRSQPWIAARRRTVYLSCRIRFNGRYGSLRWDACAGRGEINDCDGLTQELLLF
jgi:hypothetical protein